MAENFERAYYDVHSPKLHSYDRFIPFRPSLNVNLSHLLIMSPCKEEKVAGQSSNDQMRLYDEMLSDILDTPRNKRILPIANNQESQRVYSPISPYMILNEDFFKFKRKSRKVMTSPKRILDMPKLRNDFYTNVLDWGRSNRIVVALQKTTYIWDVETTNCTQINIESNVDDNFYVSATTWDDQGSKIAIGDNHGHLSLYDVDSEKILRNADVKGGAAITVAKWKDSLIYCGCRKGGVTMHDPRCPETSIGQLLGHGQDICGMQISENAHDLAAGGNGGIVTLWDMRSRSCYQKIAAHIACAKAMSWCPWRRSVLATGGGARDGYIRLWQVHTGEMLCESYTKSQVCGLLWSDRYREIVSSHGTVTPDNNDIVLWRMSQFQFQPLARLQQHFARPLHISLSPDQTSIASAGVDEMMCIWDCFPENPERHRRESSSLVLEQAIR